MGSSSKGFIFRRVSLDGTLSAALGSIIPSLFFQVSLETMSLS